ncbi:WYL domain-containing protein [Paenibacillus athensensis]|uniref:WYL domain-containing protein n=1 Tax=Paenibacillus athensensis TaxID=1967502 RepID=A0A4Y8PWN2_9BACL|nr:WYL domain-containing protein [Paenibacillus athensensis]MCD1261442.1 WYL domain-containing protein [Paenibacillus athensensis]
MNPFEKIFNYQVISRLDETGSFAVTSHERVWLKTMLAHPAAVDAFDAATLERLRGLLAEEATLDFAGLLREKAGSAVRHVYHPLLRRLRRCIARRQGLVLTYRIKDGQQRAEQPGYPYKLEYSMVKREWYVLWYHTSKRRLMTTRLQSIEAVADLPLSAEEAERHAAVVARKLDGGRTTAVVELVRDYNRELSRILYAFSCFEKAVDYDDSEDRYRITLTFAASEGEYLLSKLRFLGKRVRLVGNAELQRRMLESATLALARYSGADSSDGSDGSDSSDSSDSSATAGS